MKLIKLFLLILVSYFATKSDVKWQLDKPYADY